MTKALEDLLGVPGMPKGNNRSYDDPVDEEDDAQNQITTLADYDKISKSLPSVSGLGKTTDRELNEVYDKAIEAYDDLMDLGMNVEQRYSGRIFEVANSLLKTGLDARVAKMEKKLKMVELQLKKEKQDNEEKERVRRARKEAKSPDEDGFETEDGNATYMVTDRNSLLNQLNQLNSKGSDSKDQSNE